MRNISTRLAIASVCFVAFMTSPQLTSSAEAQLLPWNHYGPFGYGPIFPRRYVTRYRYAPMTYGVNYGYTAYRPVSSLNPITTFYPPAYSVGSYYGSCGCDPCGCGTCSGGCGATPCQANRCDPCASDSTEDPYSPGASPTSVEPQTFERNKPDQSEGLEDDFKGVPKRGEKTSSPSGPTLGEADNWKGTGTGSDENESSDSNTGGFVGPEMGGQGAGSNENASGNETPLAPMNRQPADAEPSGVDDSEEEILPPDFPGVLVEPLSVESTAVIHVAATRNRVVVHHRTQEMPVLARINSTVVPKSATTIVASK